MNFRLNCIILIFSLLATNNIFAQQIKVPVKKEEPQTKKTVTPTTNPSISNKQTLKICPTIRCTVKIDGESKGVVDADGVLKVGLNKGTFLIEAVSIENTKIRYSTEYTVDEVNIEKLFKIDFTDILAKANEQTVWNDAVSTGTLTAFQNYISTYPSGLHNSEANVNIERLYWENTKRANTKKAYQEFIALYPKSVNVVQANEEIKNFTELEKYKPAPAGMTAEKVIDNFLTAIGGRINLYQIKDITTIYTLNFNETLFELKECRKAPNKYILITSMGSKIIDKRIFNGTRGVSISPSDNKTEEITGKELEKLKEDAILNSELDYAGHGFKLRLLGIETFNGKEAYKIEFLPPSGSKYYYYYDINSCLAIGSIHDEIQMEYSNYKFFVNLRFPGTMIQKDKDKTFEFNLKSVEANTNLDDKLFDIN